MKPTDFAKYLTAFFSGYLPGVRNLSGNTIRYNPMTSYTVVYNDIGNTFQEFLVDCIIAKLGSMSPVSLFITPNK